MAGMVRNAYGYPYGNYPGAPLQQMPAYQMPGYGWPMQQTQQGPAQMSKPTVHADIIQIETEAAGENEPVDAGTSQMMITKDEQTILIKTVLANGETTMDVYRRQPRMEKKADAEYVTREEFEKRIAEMLKTETTETKTRRTAREE